MLDLLHADLLNERARSQVAELVTLTSAVKAEGYVVVGIPPRLTFFAHRVLHDLANALQIEKPAISHGMAFAQIVARVQQADLAHKRTCHHIHFLALARAYDVRFVTVDDALRVIDDLHLMFAPVFDGEDKDVARRGFWTQIGNFFAVLGKGLQEKQQIGMQEIAWLATAISATQGAVAVRELLEMFRHAQAEDMDLGKLLELVLIAPARVHELNLFLVDGVLVNAAVDELIIHSQLYLALTLPALRSLLEVWEPGEDLEEIARVLADDLRTLNNTR